MNSDEQPVEFRVTATDIHWSEGDVLTLSGALAGSGIQFFHPSRVFLLLYTSQPYKLSGVILGREISGFVSLDEYYSLPLCPAKISKSHGSSVTSRPRLIFTNEFADGTVQFGHVLRGTVAGAAAVVEGSNLIASTEPSTFLPVDAQSMKTVAGSSASWCRSHLLIENYDHTAPSPAKNCSNAHFPLTSRGLGSDAAGSSTTMSSCTYVSMVGRSRVPTAATKSCTT